MAGSKFIVLASGKLLRSKAGEAGEMTFQEHEKTDPRSAEYMSRTRKDKYGGQQKMALTGHEASAQLRHLLSTVLPEYT